MTPTLMLWVLLAAALHATWNLFVKGHQDPSVSMTAVVLGHMPIAAALLVWVPLPHLTAWPYLVAGTLLHLVYQITLMAAYRWGDLSHVYPLARGTAPLVVTLVSVTWLHKALSPLELLAIALIVVGLFSQIRFRRDAAAYKAVLLSLFTGLVIAGYTLIDGLGARVAGTGPGFYAVLALANGLLMAFWMAWQKPGLVGQVVRRHWGLALRGGTASFAAYALVIWAYTQAPIALVAALRETSVLFAVLLGMVFLRERPRPAAMLAAALMVMGLMLLRMASDTL